ncbi:siroheme synthase 1 [Arthrobacter sp. Hiyo8]|nr:siroheme synthase 1 [Arthrobacter sp. Hiyo8]
MTVVAPVASDALRELAASGLLTWEPRTYLSSDVDGVWFVQTATGVPAMDAQVAADAEAQRIWCVNASDHESSAAWTPAVAVVDDVKIAINAGGDPRRAMALRDAVATALETGDLPLRRRRASTGSVALVGGGPGDSGLITVRGRRLLGQADVVVADRLGPRDLLQELAPDVRVIEVGKTPATTPCRNWRSTGSWWRKPWPATVWCGSKAATPTSWAAAARKPNSAGRTASR